ncbi:MAG: peptidoglycan-binding domain-containing protein [Terriglobia bacterium]
MTRRRVSTRGRAYRRGTRRVMAPRRRMPGLEIPPARAQQIQQALIQDGDYRGLPTGRWDTQTRAAMRLYQHKNGFQATGLPDAKSLMKMGLGPHPLPPQLDPLAQAGAGASVAGAARDQAAIPPQ